MLTLIFLPVWLAAQMILLPFRLLSYLLRSTAFLYGMMVVGALSLGCAVFNVMRPLMGVVFLVAGLSLLYSVFQEKGGMTWLDAKLARLRVR